MTSCYIPTSRVPDDFAILAAQCSWTGARAHIDSTTICALCRTELALHLDLYAPHGILAPCVKPPLVTGHGRASLIRANRLSTSRLKAPHSPASGSDALGISCRPFCASARLPAPPRRPREQRAITGPRVRRDAVRAAANARPSPPRARPAPAVSGATTNKALECCPRCAPRPRPPACARTRPRPPRAVAHGEPEHEARSEEARTSGVPRRCGGGRGGLPGLHDVLAGAILSPVAEEDPGLRRLGGACRARKGTRRLAPWPSRTCAPRRRAVRSIARQSRYAHMESMVSRLAG